MHAYSITAAILPPQTEHVEVVQLSGVLMRVCKVFGRLSEHGPVGGCYEASGAGFVQQRVLTQNVFSSEVIAPSLIPRKPGERRKTDRATCVGQ